MVNHSQKSLELKCIRIKMKITIDSSIETYYKFKYPTHIFRSEKLFILKGKFVSCPEHDHVIMVDHGQQSKKN